MSDNKTSHEQKDSSEKEVPEWLRYQSFTFASTLLLGYVSAATTDTWRTIWASAATGVFLLAELHFYHSRRYEKLKQTKPAKSFRDETGGYAYSPFIYDFELVEGALWKQSIIGLDVRVELQGVTENVVPVPRGANGACVRVRVRIGDFGLTHGPGVVPIPNQPEFFMAPGFGAAGEVSAWTIDQRYARFVSLAVDHVNLKAKTAMFKLASLECHLNV